MNRYLFIAVLILIVAVAGALLWLLPVNQTSTVPIEPVATTTPETEPEPAPELISFTSEPFASTTFSLRHREDATIELVSEGIYELKYIGPEAEVATEITDGYYMSFRFSTSSSLQAYVATLDTVATPTAATVAGNDALRIQTRSALGNNLVTHFAVSTGASTTLDVSASTYGDRAPQYDTEVQQILDSITFASATADSGSGVPADVQAQIDAKADTIIIDTPEPGSTITSPLEITGEARGPWFFEASAPVMLVDWDGRIIAESYIEAEESWMTEDFVPFSGTIEFESPYTAGAAAFQARGTLIMQKANPSDLPENDDALEIPVMYPAETPQN